MVVVDAHQPGGLGIVGRRAKRPPQRRPVEQQLQRRDDQHGGGENEQRQPADGEPAAKLEAGGLQRADLQLAAVGGEDLEQRVLDDDRQAEGDQQRRQDVAAERAVQQAALQAVADCRHHRHDDDQRQQRRQAQPLRHRERDEGGQHDQVAMRDVDQPHDAEDQRQPGGEQRIEPAEQDALQHGVDPLHHTPK